MKNQKTSHFDASTKIRCMIEMALSKEIPWSTVHSTVEKLTSTFEKSKQVNNHQTEMIKILTAMSYQKKILRKRINQLKTLKMA